MDQELQRLIARDRDSRLNRLEKDIWRRESALQVSSAAGRRLVSWQGVVLAMAVISSASVGVRAASAVPPPEKSLFGDDARLAPTALLFGPKP
jgi:hypothetical protein